MTSTASKYKNYTSFVFRKTFKSNLVSMLLALGATIVVTIITITSTVLQDSYDYGITKTLIGDVDVTGEAGIICVFFTIISGFFSLFSAPRIFKQIYKKQSCDSYFAVPIKREEYFVANYLYGVLVNVLCYVVPLALYCLAVSVASNKYVNYVVDYKTLVPIVISLLLAVIAIYSAFVMCAVISGKRIQYLILSLICLVCTSTALGGIAVKINSIWGFSADLLLLNAVSPVDNAISSFMSQEKLYIPLIVSALEIVGMFIAGYIAFKGRKAETAEMSLSGKIIPYIILAVLSSSAFFFSATESGVVAIIIGIVLAVLITMAFTAVFYKKVFTKQTAVTLACVCGVCTVLSVGVTLPIFNGYVKYVPDVDSVESVELSTLTFTEGYTGMAGLLNDSVSYLIDEDSVVLQERENIEKVIELHNRSIDDLVIKTSRKNSSSILRLMLFLGNDYFDNYEMDISYKLTYKLNDGRVVERRYAVPNTLIKQQFINVLQTEEVLSQLPPFCIDNDRLLAVDFMSYENEYMEETYDIDDYDLRSESDYEDYSDIYEYSTVELEGFDVEKFNEALMKDYLAMKQDTFIQAINQFQIYCFGSDSYYYDDAICELSVYYATPKMSDEDIAKYKKMSKYQIMSAVDEDWYDEIEAEHIWLTVSKNSSINTIKYLNSCGAGLSVE